MSEPVLFHCAHDDWVYRKDPNLHGKAAEYDIKKAMHAHVLMSLIYQDVPSNAHRFRSGAPAIAPDGLSARSRDE